MKFKLSGHIALVTGAGRGIGAEIAKTLAEAGADIIVNDLDSKAAEKTAEMIQKTGRKVHVSIHDISLYEEAKKCVEGSLQVFGKITHLINNAGITRDSLLLKLSEEKWDEVIRVNLKGPFNITQFVAPNMIEHKFGRIINLSSIAHHGNIGQTNYSASKAGVIGLTRTCALELAKYGITVNAIAPGLVDSILTQQIPADVKEKFIQKIPLKRIGTPRDIANLTLFLSSEESSYLTGQCIEIDGGLCLGF